MKAASKLARPLLVALLSLGALPCFTGSALGAPPAPVITSPASGSFTNDSEPAFSGTAEDELDPVVLNIYEGGSASGSPVRSSSTVLGPLGGSWSLGSGGHLDDGEYTAVAKQTDLFFETATSAPVSFTVDTGGPAVSVNSVSSPSKNSSPTLEGKAGTSPGDAKSVTVTIHAGGSVAGAVVGSPHSVGVGGGGSWSFTVPTLGDGTYTAQVTQQDQAGNGGEDSTTFTIDTVGPALSIDSVPTPSSNATPTLGGNGGTAAGDQGNVTVTIHAGGSVGGSVVGSPHGSSVSGGRWSWTVPTLSDGTYTVQAVQKDNAGNSGEATPVTFTVNATLPTVSINSVTSPTKVITPTLEGHAGTSAGDDKFVTVSIHAGSSTAGPVVGPPAQVSLSGNSWTYTPSLADGTFTAQVTQKNEVGATAEDSTTFTIDTTPPVLSINAVPSPGTNATPTLEGAGGQAPGDSGTVTVTLHAGGSVGGAVVGSPHPATLSGGKWSWTVPTLADGTYTVQAAQKDAAGNNGEASPVTFIVNATPPSVSINAVASPTKNITPTLEGHAGTSAGDDKFVTVTIHAGSSTAGPAVGPPAQVSLSGNSWTYTPSLADGTFTAQVTERNQAGVIAEASATFTIDTTKPVVTIAPIPSPTNVATPTMSGTAGKAPEDAGTVTVTLHAGTTVGGAVVGSPASVSAIGGEWTFTPAHLNDGTYTVQVTQKDQVGNVGEAAPVTFTVDTTGPAVSIEGVASPGKNATPTLKGTGGVAPGDGAVIVTLHAGTSVGGAVVAGPQAVGLLGGKWSLTTPPLGDATYTAQVTQKDASGNGSEASTTFTIDTTAPIVSVQQVTSPTGDPTPTLSGAGGTALGDAASVTITVHQGATVGGPVQGSPASVTVTAGNWNYTTPTLADGTYTVQAVQKDLAGNVGEAAPMTFIVNATVPAVTIAPVATPSKNTAPTLKGAAGTRAEDAKKVNVTVTRGAETVRAQAVDVVAGGWSLALSPLTDGTYKATATQTDAAAVTGEASTTFTIDTVPPAVSIAQPGKVFKVSTPTLEGKAGTQAGDRPTVTITIHAGKSITGAVVGTPGTAPVAPAGWNYTVPHLSDGAYTAQVKQEDEAGNSAEAAAAVTFEVDTTPPTPKILLPANGSELHKAQPEFGGTRGVEPTDETSLIVYVYKGVTATGLPLLAEEVKAPNPAWGPQKAAPLSNGQYTAVAEQRDEAGNVGLSDPVHFEIRTESPEPKITTGYALRGNAAFTGSSPSFGGTADTDDEDANSVTAQLYRIEKELGHVKTTKLNAFKVPLDEAGDWSTGQLPVLEPGEYRVQIEQAGPKGSIGFSPPLNFTVDTAAPQPTLSTPANGSTIASASAPVSGDAGTAVGDASSVTVLLFKGTTAEGPAADSITVPVAGGGWSGSFDGLGPGTYTVRAQQGDDVGNVGVSNTTTFALGAAPTAAFQWIPAKPHVGEAVSLISTSTDPVSPITAFAWDVAGTGTFTPGEAVLHTKFTTAGNHVVRLRVTDSLGASSTVASTIPVSRVVAVLMSPFPIVRIAGAQTAAGARIKLLTVQALLGARVSITCRGKGCPTKSVSALATLSKSKGKGKGKAKSKAGTVLIPFHRFERGLRAGVVLEIRVSKAGQIGKYTRFSVRLGKLPRRVDMCLSPAGVKPIVCPTS